MKSIKREAGGDVGIVLASDLVLVVNPRVTSSWASRSADVEARSRHVTAVADESVGLSTLRAEERTLLALADGHRSIDDLARLAGMPTLVAVQHLRSLCDRGILVPADASGLVEDDYAAGSDGSGPQNPGAEVTAPRESDSGPSRAVRLSSSPSPSDDHPVQPKKSGSGPNVTLFWIPTPAEQAVFAGAVAAAAKSVEDSGKVAAPLPPRESGPGGTVMVMGSPGGATTDSGRAAASADSGRTAVRADSGKVAASADSGRTAAGTDSGRVAASADSGRVAASADSGRAAAGADSGRVVASADSGKAVAGTDAVPATQVPDGASASPSAAIPFRVGSYEVATRIAQGAMGSVYVCRRVGAAGFQRLFTLKVVREHSTQKDVAVRSFMREARVGALLNHPNVQTLVDVGNYEDQPFLILDYIEGANLSELLADDRRPPARIVVAVLLDILRGLQHVHDVADEQGRTLGLVHGDVSPQNVLVGVDGAARLTDFGSARFTAEGHAIETDSGAVGKPAYMAPEQLRGEPSDARTDLFSVGAVMWTALTGQKLFAADTYDQTVIKVMRRKVPAPSEFGSPACLDAIILRALTRSPVGRYSGAEEMARDILHVATQENLVASAREVGQWVRTELGETLADRRRQIQEMFGGTGKTPGPPVRAPASRPRRPTPRTADGFDRLPAKTVVLGTAPLKGGARGRGDGDGDRMAASASPGAKASPASGNTRAQWVVVMLSAVIAACALTVAIVYLVSSLTTSPKPLARNPPVGPSAISEGAGSAPAARVPSQPGAKNPAEPELRSDMPQGR